MTRPPACLVLRLASSACLGDPVSGGATLSGGTGGGSGGGSTTDADGGSAAVDDGSTTDGAYHDGLPSYEAAWQSAIDDATVAAAALGDAYEALRQDLQQQRDALDGFAALPAE